LTTIRSGWTETCRLGWPPNFSKVVAEVQQKNIERVGMPQWSEADQTLANALQKEIGQPTDGLKTKVDPLKPPSPETEKGGSDDVGDISWNLPMVYLRYSANIPHTPGPSWVDGVGIATPIAHKGSTAGAKVQALTALDFLLSGARQTGSGLFHERPNERREVHPSDRPGRQAGHRVQ
jgi:aminobenzoyl-glutamate utilization protein B